MTMWAFSLNQAIKLYLNNMVNLHQLTPHTYTKLYPQNDDRIVTIDAVTSSHPVYKCTELLVALCERASDVQEWARSWAWGDCALHRVRGLRSARRQGGRAPAARVCWRVEAVGCSCERGARTAPAMDGFDRPPRRSTAHTLHTSHHNVARMPKQWMNKMNKS